MISVSCIYCQKELEIGSQPEIGQRLVCPFCSTQLEVLWLYPISLGYPEEIMQHTVGQHSPDESLPKILEV